MCPTSCYEELSELFLNAILGFGLFVDSKGGSASFF